MKKIFALLYMSVALLPMAWSESVFPEVKPQGLPVLQVSFPAKSLSTTYVEGVMRLTPVEGKVVELNAKFKTRGATASQYSMKPAFNMKLRDEKGEELDSALLGMRSLSSWILDAMAIDRIGMRNRVAFDVWNEFSRLPYTTSFEGRSGTTGRFVEVYINNVYKGIYCLTDRINRKLLDLKKPQVDTVQIGTLEDGTPKLREDVTIRGVLYKHGTNDIGDQNHVAYSEDSVAYVIAYHDAWELAEPEKYAGKQAWAPLEDIYAHRRDYEWICDHFFVEELAEYQVFIMALSITDNWGAKNSYIGARNVTTDGAKHKFVYVPWDLDTSLGGGSNGKYYDGQYSSWKPTDVVKSSVMPVPFSVCNGKADYKEMLRNAWIRGREGALSYESIKEKLYRYRDLFLASGAWERSVAYWESQRYKPCYVTDLAKEIEYILVWYKNRISEMDAYFDVREGIATPACTTAAPRLFYNLQGIQEPKAKVQKKNTIYVIDGKKVIGEK